jgi:hypothetical protein
MTRRRCVSDDVLTSILLCFISYKCFSADGILLEPFRRNVLVYELVHELPYSCTRKEAQIESLSRFHGCSPFFP